MLLQTLEALFTVVGLIFIFTFHNYIKAWVALKLGDKTPKELGFLTFNPLHHIDVVGTIVVPFLLLLLGSPIVIGWPRMVPVNVYAFKNPRRDAIILTLISIFSYFLIAFVGLILFKILYGLQLPENIALPLLAVFKNVVFGGVIFGLLNLIPIPPFDMGIVLFLIFGKSLEEINALSVWGMVIVLILFVSGFLNTIFIPILNWVNSLL